MEEALHDVSLYCEFARLDPGSMRLPDETTILRFRRLQEEHKLSIQLLATINATLVTKGLMLKASVRAKVEHSFRVIKCLLGFTKVRYKDLAKNTTQLITLFALSNLWMTRNRLMLRART